MRNINTIELEDKETCVIIDANSWVHKCYHACAPIYDQRGKDQRVLHGTLAVLGSLTNYLKRTDFIITVFDPIDGDLFRKAQFSGYKANRPPTEPELLRQKNDTMHALKNIYGIPDVSFSGYEADDIIGSLAKVMSKDMQVVVISPDKDIAQIVDSNIFLMRQYKDKEGKKYQMMNDLATKDLFGVYPKQIPDYLALMGDAVDNLPGLKNVGAKTSAKIISKYISVENMLRDPNQIEEKDWREKILEARENLPLIRSLATIVNDLPIHKNLEQSLDHAQRTRENHNYKNNIIRAEQYFNLKSYVKNLFL
jgi:DNA polymerase-1